MARITFLLVLGALLAAPAARADIYVMKDGDIIEGKFVKEIVKKIPGQGGPKSYCAVKLEDGSEKEFLVKEIEYIIKKRPSWEVRKENKDWYAKDSPNVKAEWKAQEEFAKKCRNKGHLDDEALVHFKKSYELRKPEIKDDIAAHTAVARLLEKDYGLYDEAKEEWRWIYAKKSETTSTAPQHVALAKWCADEGLYDEALGEYGEALKLEPGSLSAKSGLDKLKRALEVPVYAQMHRIVKGPLRLSINWLLSQQKQDGSFGSDITEAGVHGHLGMSCLVGLALIAQWEFDALEDFDKAKEPSTALVKLLGFVLTSTEKGKGLRGPDVWGEIFRIEFLAKCYKKPAFDSKKEAIRKRVADTLVELQKLVRTDGGWSYYDFVTTGTTFVTACAIVAMVEAKEAGLPYEEGMVAKACRMIEGVRKKPGVYTYHAQAGDEAEVGCAGRSSLCEYALLRAGKDGSGLATAVGNFFRYRHLLAAIKGQEGTHIGEGKTAPYYYLFGHYWTTRAIKGLPKGQQLALLKKMGDAFLRDQEASGVFTDSKITKDGKVYGTALGALCLYQHAVDVRPK